MNKQLSAVDIAADSAAKATQNLIEANAAQADMRTTELVKNVIEDFFNKGQEEKRFIDTARIPFICDDIKEIRRSIETVTRLVFIGLGIVTTLGFLMPFVVRFFIK